MQMKKQSAQKQSSQKPGKVYSSKSVADQIAAKLSKKAPHQVVDVEGGYKVVAEAELQSQAQLEEAELQSQAQLGEADAVPDFAEPAEPGEMIPDGSSATDTVVVAKDDSSSSPMTPAMASLAAKHAAAELVAVEIIGAYLTPDYAITPSLGEGTKARPRWFERKRLAAAEPVDINGKKGLRLVLPRKALLSRGLNKLAADAQAIQAAA